MNKQELARRVAKKNRGVTTAVAKKIIEDALYEISKAIRREEEVRVPPFGKFYPRKRQSRMAYNPSNGEEVFVPERITGAFSPGKNMKVR